MAFQAGLRAKECCLALEATNRGKAVVGCGATKSFGGIDALEKLAKRNAKRHRRTKMAVDLADCPTFTFGNSRRAKVNGRATFEIEAKGQRGTFDIHGLNAKGVPILVSIDTLAKMGAVIDFRTGRAIYQALDPNAIIQLEKATTGHLLMDLAEDLCEDEVRPSPEDAGTQRLAAASSSVTACSPAPQASSEEAGGSPGAAAGTGC